MHFLTVVFSGYDGNRLGEHVFLSKGNVGMRRNKPPPPEVQGYKSHLFVCQTTSSPFFCKVPAPLVRHSCFISQLFFQTDLAFGMSHKILVFHHSWSQIPVCKSLFAKQCERTGLGVGRDTIALETTKPAGCWRWELSSWNTAGKSHSQGHLAEKKCFMESAYNPV